MQKEATMSLKENSSSFEGLFGMIQDPWRTFWCDLGPLKDFNTERKQKKVKYLQGK